MISLNDAKRDSFITGRIPENPTRSSNLSNSNSNLHNSAERQLHIKGAKENPYRILHVAFEFAESTVGGLGSVINTLVPCQNKYGQACEQNLGVSDRYQKVKVITPLFDFVLHKETALKLKGTFAHEVYGSQTEFQVFKRKLVNGVKHYLIAPDAPRKFIFDVKDANSIYSSFPYSESQDRNTFFSSAAAAFASHCKNKHGEKKFDIVHCHGWHTAFVTSLIKEKYLPEFTKINRDVPKTVTTFHIHSGEQGYLENSVQTKRIDLAREADINQAAEQMFHSDYITTVSQAMLNEASTPKTGYNLDHLFRGALELNCISGISNGIDTSAWNPSNANKLGALAFTSDNILEGKHNLKNYLVEKGLIADASKRLVLFLGRYSSEKGVDMLEHAVEATLQAGGSFICMGKLTNDQKAKNIMESLVEKYRNHADVHIILSAEEQDKYGYHVRNAADFFLVPSHKEACGLVPMEAFCSGALVISSAEQGLKDILRDIILHPEGEQIGNSFTYFNGEGREHNIQSCLQRTFAFMDSLTTEEEQQLRARVMNSAKHFDWNAENGPLEKMLSAYKRALARN